MIKNTWCISTNKLLYEIFNFTYNSDEIKTTGIYKKDENGKNKYVNAYYIEFDYEEFKGNISKVKIISEDKDNLAFTIYEELLYFMLISNARQSNDKDNYYISMRKLRSIRGLKGNSVSSYNRYEEALHRLSNKTLMVLPIKSTYQREFISCNMISIFNINQTDKRISDFSYSFNELDKLLIHSRQKIDTTYNPFEFISKQYFSFLTCLQFTRYIALNVNGSNSSRKYSIQKLLMGIHKVNKDGIIESLNYYQYIVEAGNKQSEKLNKCYTEIESILKMLVKHKYIKNYNISKKRSFKYLKDNEVFVQVFFIR